MRREAGNLSKRGCWRRFLLSLFAMSLFLCGCRAYEEAHRQLPTFADMQDAAFQIQDHIDIHGEIGNEEAMRIVSLRNSGLDRWGSPIVFVSRKNESGFSFVLVSFGSDRKLDVTDINQYFLQPRENIVGKLSRDIVFRDGQWVTAASAK